MDPMYLFASEERIRREVANNVADAGSGWTPNPKPLHL